MSKTLLQPTTEIYKASILLEEVIKRFTIEKANLQNLDYYESSNESLVLMNLAIRNIEGVLVLAKTNLNLLPAAITLSRTAYEITIKILWMIEPEDPFQREVRWLAHLKGEESYNERLAKKYDELGVNNDELIEIKNRISDFRQAVENLLSKKGYSPLPKLPDLAAMVKSLNDSRKYLPYIILSQFAHGSHNGASLYRKNLGNQKQIGEFITPDLWNIPISISWFCLHSAGSKIFKRLGGNAEKYLDEDFALNVQLAIDKIK